MIDIDTNQCTDSSAVLEQQFLMELDEEIFVMHGSSMVLPSSVTHGDNMRPAIVSAVKREFHGHSRHLHHNKPEQFCRSQWHAGGSSKFGIWMFLVYRWILALFLTLSLIVSIIDIRTLGWPEESVRRAKWLIYMTNWSLLLLTVQFLLAAVLATRHHLQTCVESTEQTDKKEMTKLHKIYWILNNLTNALAPAITIGYWATVYNPEIHRIDFLNIFAHILNTIIVIVDLWIAGHPIRLLHAYQPVIITFIYTGFSAIYYVAGGTNRDDNPKIYPLLNWSKPHWAVLAAVGASIFLVIIHIFMWLMYLLRRRIAIAILGKERRAQITTQNCGEVTVTSGLV